VLRGIDTVGPDLRYKGDLGRGEITTNFTSKRGQKKRGEKPTQSASKGIKKTWRQKRTSGRDNTLGRQNGLRALSREMCRAEGERKLGGPAKGGKVAQRKKI